jgi:hypothetical protein
MMEAPAARPMVDRLSPVRCGQCNRPVTHLNKSVPGSEAGALCTNCNKDGGVRIKVYTFVAVAPCECGCHVRGPIPHQ